MKKKLRSGLLFLGLVALVGMFAVSGCTKAQQAALEALLNETTTIGSSEVTLSGTISLSGDTVDVNLNSVLISGEPVTLTSGKIKVQVGTSVDTVSGEDLIDFTLPTVTDRPLDIAFILDNTGSMAGAINGAEDSIIAFSASLEAAGVDARFGLVTYGDSALHPTPVGYITAEGQSDANTSPRPVLDFSTAAALKDVLTAEVEAEGGQDGPENPLDAIMYAYNNFSWRTTAQRVFVVITDITAHQNNGVDVGTNNVCTTSGEAVVEALAGRAVIYAVSPNYTTALTGGVLDVRRLADGLGEGRTTPLTNTGGKWIVFNSGSFDLNTLGIDTALTALTTIRFSYSFEAGVYYIYVQVDSDGDGVFDSNIVIKITVASASATGFSTFGTPAKVMNVEVLEADDGKARPNN
jgi:hypothetical protein